MNRKSTSIRGIYEYDNGTFIVRVTKKCLNGRIIEKSKQANTIEEAIAVKSCLMASAKEESELQNRYSIFNPDKSFSEYVEWYLSELISSGNRKASVVEGDRFYFNSVINPIIGQVKLSQISRQSVYFFLTSIANSKTKFGNPYSNASQKRAYILFRGSVRFALKRGIISSDPTQNIDFKFNSKVPERNKTALSIEEVSLILSKARTSFGIGILAILAVGFTTGMRMSELSALELADIDFENRLINVRRSVYRGRVSQTTKNGSHNQVPLLPDIAIILEDYIKTRNDKLNANMTLFYGIRNGGFVTVSTINPILKKLCIECGIPIISAHGMRRTLNSILINSNVSPLTTAKILNHKSVSMTYHYYRISGSAKLDAVQGAFNPDNSK